MNRTHVTRPVLLSFLLSLVFSLSCSADTTTDFAELKSPGDYDIAIQFQDRERYATVHIPEGFADADSLPLVLMFHGGGGNAVHASHTTEWHKKADAENFIVIYPEGTGRMPHTLLTWNAGRCCAYAEENNIDDAGYTKKLIDMSIADLKVDPSRVFVTGFSNGGMVAHRIGCELAGTVAAIAPVGGSHEYPDCDPAEPISVIIVHGTDDNNVPFEGGRGKKAIVKLKKTPVLKGMKYWAHVNSCDKEPVTEDDSGYENVELIVHENCDNSQEVVLYKIIGGTHSWPGGKKQFSLEDTPVDFFPATDVIWDFFSKHGLKKE